MEQTIDESKLLKVDELAEWLRVKESWVYVHADELGAYHLGKYLRFSLSRVQKILEDGAIGGPNVKLPTQRPVPNPTKKDSSGDHGTNSEQI